MGYTIIIAVIFGILVGAYFTRRNGSGLIALQSKKKTKNKEKILEFLRKNGKIQNDDVEKLVEVSNATAERYLDELELDGKLEQHGKTGQSVFYTLKN